MKPVYQRVELAGLRTLALETHELLFEQPELADSIRPGQFCMISPLPGTSNVFLPRPFSYFYTDAGMVHVLFRTFGRATKWMSRLRSGDSIGVFGPLGNSFELEPGAKHALLAGGGIGIPPLVMLARSLARRGGLESIDLVYGERLGGSAVLLEGIVPGGVRLHMVTEDGSLGEQGLVTGPAGNILGELNGPPAVYTCGPRPMMAALADMLAPGSVSLFQASCEENMACGRGICQGCVIPVLDESAPEGFRYERCCTEGPVFNGFEVKWD